MSGENQTRKITYERIAARKNGVLRVVYYGIAIIIQVLFLVSVAWSVNNYAEWIALGTRIFGLFLILGIYGMAKTSSMKTPWIILILLLPVFGIVTYLLVGMSGGSSKMRKRYEREDEKLFPLIPQDEVVYRAEKQSSMTAANLSSYLVTYSGYPVYQGDEVTYFSEAMNGLEAQIAEMKKAKHFIFMEYHAIENAESWMRIQEVLEERVQAGVEVRVFYDDLGSMGFINNTQFKKQLESVGIACRVFNPMMPFFNLFLNNRDHRKITVIDGEVGFTGGYNIANEYFNVTHPYGYWKDTGVMIRGNSVRNLTIAFLEMWNAVRERDLNISDVDYYLKENVPHIPQKGFIQPYADTPLDDEQVGENVYINLIEQAQHYIYFMTPYLIITDEMQHALGLAAKRGVDVRIITPGIPDKRIIYTLTRSYYNDLIEMGVRIYEYTPGFCHAKMCVTDDRFATVGTINLDYRSLYHHFENGCLFYDCKVISDIRKDFEKTFSESKEVLDGFYARPGSIRRYFIRFLRLFAPLL